MLKIYKTENERVYEKLKKLLNTDCEIKRTENGKPYIEGAEFSITHTGGTALIAISDKPVGIDAEMIKELNYSSILQRFTLREQAEIDCTAAFLKNWVVKEAYIKKLGETLAHCLKRLEYFGGNLFSDGKKVNCNIYCRAHGGLIYAVCADGEIPTDIETIL